MGLFASLIYNINLIIVHNEVYRLLKSNMNIILSFTFCFTQKKILLKKKILYTRYFLNKKTISLIQSVGGDSECWDIG